MERIQHYKHILWRGKWRPFWVSSVIIGTYDLIVAQFFPNSSLPTVSDIIPQWHWWAWVMLILVFIVVASLEGSYRRSKEVKHTPVNGIATSVIAVENYDYEFITESDPSYRQDSVVLRLNPEIHALPGVRVEDIQLELKGKRYDTDWEPMTKAISRDIGNYVYVDLPKSLKAGKYQARIVAHINNTEYYSDEFTVEYQRPGLDKAGSQS